LDLTDLSKGTRLQQSRHYRVISDPFSL
jgi:hypothetical protein